MKLRVTATVRKASNAELLMEKIRKVLSPDLLKKPYREENKTNPTFGHCYAASEALYYLLGGKDAGYTPMHGRDPQGIVHWWLRGPGGEILDPTKDQYTSKDQIPPYNVGVGGGFLTKTPSERALAIMDRIRGHRASSEPELRKYSKIKNYSAADAKQEYDEELKVWKATSGEDSPFELRFPGVDKKKVPFLLNEKLFVQKVLLAPVKYLSLEEIQSVYNFAQAVETAEMVQAGKSKEDLFAMNFDFFKDLQTDKDASGKSHNKGESYKHWCGRIEKGEPLLPSILLHANGHYFQIVGQTRLVAGLTNGYLMPCLILYSDK
jgi:hypothetical protein